MLTDKTMFEFKVGDVVKVVGRNQGVFTVEASDDTKFPLKVGTNTFTKHGQFFSDNGTVFLTLIARPRKQWFLDRIGKVVYVRNICQCNLCLTSEKRGKLIENEETALRAYLSEFNPPEFFDTYEELINHKENA